METQSTGKEALSSQVPGANILYSHLLNSASHQISCILLSWSQFWSPPISPASFWQPIFPVCGFSIKCDNQDTAMQHSLIGEPSREYKWVSYYNLKLSKQTNAVIVEQIPPLFWMSCPHYYISYSVFLYLSLPIFYYQNEKQIAANQSSFFRNFQCEKAPHWQSNFFSSFW